MGWVSGGGVAAVALLVLAAPIASASSVLTFTAPYVGMSKSLGNAISSNGCLSAASESVIPSFSTHTGIFRVAGTTSAGYCGGSASYSNTGEVLGSVTLTGPNFHVPSSGAYKVGVIWKLTYTASIGAVLRNATTNTTFSFVEASAQIVSYMYVYDVTNGTTVIGTGVNFLTIADWTLLSSGTVSVSSGPTSYGLTDWVKLHSGHTYQAVICLNAFAFSSTDASAGFHDSARASINLGSGGNEALLAHIVVV